MNRFAKMKKERIYTLFETLSVFLLLVIAAKNAHICKQKEIRVEDRIHHDVW